MKIRITESQLKSLMSLIKESYLPGLNDDEIVAATIIGEAGGETTEGMTAIYNVLVNRALNKGTSAAGESLRPKQFSMWDSVTKNVSSRKDFKVKNILSLIKEKKTHPKWSEALQIIKSAPKDVTNGATHYYAYKGPNKISTPSFAIDWKETAKIGNHKFGVA
jgi:hypothetical protein